MDMRKMMNSGVIVVGGDSIEDIEKGVAMLKSMFGNAKAESTISANKSENCRCCCGCGAYANCEEYNEETIDEYDEDTRELMNMLANISPEECQEFLRIFL